MMARVFTLRNTLIVTAAGLAGAFGYESDWGDAFVTTPASVRPVRSKHDNSAVLPDFRLSSEANAYAQITERPLLNPTRKPAPTQIVAAATEPPKPQIRRGVYTLVGVTDLGGVKVAQLKEIATGRTYGVKVGDSLQEMKVTAIENERVTLAFLGEFDALSMAKFTASGRVPQPPAMPVPAPAPPPVAPTPVATQSSITEQAATTNGNNAAATMPAAPATNSAAAQEPPLPVNPRGRLTAFDRERIARERGQ